MVELVIPVYLACWRFYASLSSWVPCIVCVFSDLVQAIGLVLGSFQVMVLQLYDSVLARIFFVEVMLDVLHLEDFIFLFVSL